MNDNNRQNDYSQTKTKLIFLQVDNFFQRAKYNCTLLFQWTNWQLWNWIALFYPYDTIV